MISGFKFQPKPIDDLFETPTIKELANSPTKVLSNAKMKERIREDFLVKIAEIAIVRTYKKKRYAIKPNPMSFSRLLPCPISLSAPNIHKPNALTAATIIPGIIENLTICFTVKL